MKGIYLFACRARHENYDLDYNDIDGKYGCNITGDAMKVSLKPYDFIIASPKEGDVVMDCFMGIGATGIACKELNRDFIGCEIDKTYFDIAKKRINEGRL